MRNHPVNHLSPPRFALKTLLALCGLALAACASAQPSATLQGLGVGFTGNAISRYGNVVVGEAENDAAYWKNGTVTELGVGAGAQALSCNEDGSVIVGVTGDFHPFIWGVTIGWHQLPSGGATGTAKLISAQSNVVVGVVNNQPVYWNLANLDDATSFGTLPDVTNGSGTVVPSAVNDDGSVIAAEAHITNTTFHVAGEYDFYTFNMDSDGTCNTEYPVLYQLSPGGEVTNSFEPPLFNLFSDTTPYGHVFCLTSNGSLGFGGWFDLFGIPTDSGYSNPFTDGLLGAEFYSSGSSSFNPGTTSNNSMGLEIHSCDRDATALTGDFFSVAVQDDGNNNAYNQLQSSGIGISVDYGYATDLVQFLTQKGASTTGWNLYHVNVQGMSADASVIIGQGVDPNGKAETWMAQLSPQLNSLTAAQGTVIGGAQDNISVGVDYPPPLDVSFPVTSSNTAAIPNSTAFLSAGAMNSTFSVQTSLVSVSTKVTLTASYNSFTAQTVVTVNPSPIEDIYVAPSIIVGGQSTHGVVQLAGPAGPSGNVVTLSSSSSDVTIPSTATVPANGTGVSFLITSKAVSAPESVTVKAEFSGAGHVWTLAVNPAPLTAFYPSPGIVTGGDTTAAYVTIGGQAGASGDLVSLSSNNSAVTLPSSVTISSGSVKATVSLHTTPVATQTVVLLKAIFGSSTVTSQLVVQPAVLSNFFASPSSGTGGSSSSGVVQLNASAATADQITLTSSSSVVTVPASVTVASGKSGASFAIQTSPVSVTTAVVMTATFGSVSNQIVFTVNTPAISNFYLSPASIKGGASTHGVVQLAGKAGPNGAIISLSSSDSHATTPTAIVIPAGSTGASFAITTKSVTSSTTVTITATYGGSSKQAVLTLN